MTEQTTAPTTSLVDWLRQQLDEDQALAERATPGPWLAQDGGVVALDDPADDAGHGTWPVASTETSRNRADRQHIAAWAPARVLAEIAAKREILDGSENPAYDPQFRGTLKWMLRVLAQPYRARPGWREEWTA